MASSDKRKILIVGRTKDDPANIALKLALESPEYGYSVESVGLDPPRQLTRGDAKIGIMVPSSGGLDFFTRLAVLDYYGSREVIAIPLHDFGNSPWGQDLGDHIGSAFRDRVQVAGSLSLESLQTTLRSVPDTLPEDRVPPWLGPTRRVTDAFLLHELIGAFTHRQQYDITNQFLAPLRLLAEESTEHMAEALVAVEALIASDAAKAAWDEFAEAVAGKLSSQGSHWFLCDSPLAKAIQEHAGHVSALVGEQERTAKTLRDCKKSLRCLPLLITECRTAAGLPAPDAACESPSFEPRRNETFRVLVIDDHYSAWKGVFDQVRRRLTSKGDHDLQAREVVFEYSKDGKRLTECEGRLVLAEYDLVMLDIFLGPEDGENGLQLLADIRQRLAWIPVIIWTSSVQEELPARANLANGFLYKKTVAPDALVGTIRRWLSAGKSQRLWSLPNPFFDHALRDPQPRQVALGLTKWSLAYMDCFHAVDHFYFRYFNDHGGRHVLGILDVTAKLLRPFLFETTENGVLSQEPGIRGKQLFCVYAALLCHEFGMFPIAKGEEPPDDRLTITPDADWKRMEFLRKLHAVRGMLMLLTADDATGSPFDVEGLPDHVKGIDETVGKSGRAAVALLMGYHQRCLSLAPEEQDCYQTESKLAEANQSNDPDEKTASKTLDEARTFYYSQCDAAPKWTQKEAVFAHTAAAWETALGGEAESAGAPKESTQSRASVWHLEGLRKLCALVRFADALDVDHTRIPAQFLVKQHAKRRPFQDREDTKRQVLGNVTIDRGVVTMAFLAAEPTDETVGVLCEFAAYAIGRCSAILEHCPHLLSPKESSDLEDLLVKVPSDWKNWDAEWLTQFGSPWPSRKSTSGPSNKEIESFIAVCLQGYFTLAKLGARICTDDDNKTEHALATAAGVLVILEVEDEYSAIEQVNLDTVITLKTVNWKGGMPAILVRDEPLRVEERQASVQGAECKLVFAEQRLAESVFDTLVRCRELGRFTFAERGQEAFEDIYYDTADGRLRAVGVSFRVRSNLIVGGPPRAQVKKRAGQSDQMKYRTRSMDVLVYDKDDEGTWDLASTLRELSPEHSEILQGDCLNQIGKISIARRLLRAQLRDSEVAELCLDRFKTAIDGREDDRRMSHEIEVKGKNALALEELGQSLCNWFGMIRVTSSKLERHLPSVPGTKRLLLDMDPGVDDALAILYAALGKEDVVIEGITTAGGNTDVGTCARNAYRICRWLQRNGLLAEIPPIATGIDLTGLRSDATNVHGEDGLGDVAWGEIDSEAAQHPFPEAVELQRDLLTRFPGELSVVATGPCSNLAELIRRHPDALRNAREIIVMGGVFFDCGNRSPGAEFNIHSDAAAARTVLEYCRQPAVTEGDALRPTVPLTFVGLDVTHRVILERAQLADAPGKAGKLALDFTRKYMDFYQGVLGVHGCPLHDPLAVAAALHPEYVVREPYHVEIVSTPDVPETDGVTIADYRPAVAFRDHAKESTHVCVSVDGEAFLADFLARLG